MKFINKLFLLNVLFIFTITNVYAQRGCCSWHGGVSGGCRNGKQVCNDGTTSPTCTCSGGYEEYKPIIIYGCTDSNSINYNPNANRNDGSCIKKIYGCTDSNAYNYNPNANTDDGKCIAKIYGCTNKKANNYNSDANTEDGTCLYTKTKYEYKNIKYKVKKEYHFLKKEGYVIRKGKSGKKKITKEEIIDENSNVISSKTITEEILNKPINKIVSTRKK